jgi:hypothetical protein
MRLCVLGLEERVVGADGKSPSWAAAMLILARYHDLWES